MTSQRLLFTLAWRNLWRHPRRTLLTVLALGLGLTFLLFSLGLGDGSHEQMIVNGIKLGGGHVVIQARGYQATRSQDLLLPAQAVSTAAEVLQTPTSAYSLDALSPRLLASGLLSSAANASGVGIVGVQPEAERDVSLIPQRMSEGHYFNSEQPSGLVIGAELAQKLKVRIGSKVVLMAQSVPSEQHKNTNGADGAGGEIQSGLFRVSGIFRTGLREVDAYVIHLPLAEAQRLLGADKQVSQIAVFLDSVHHASPVAKVLHAHFDTSASSAVEILTWHEALAELAQFVWLDDAFGYVMNGIILVMVALGVLNTMLMSVLERRYELGVCAALGLRPVQLLVLVMYESLVLIVLSLVLGLALGLGVHWYFATYGLDMRLLTETDVPIAGTVFDPILYSSLSQARIIWAVGVVGVLAILMAVYPGWKAARTELPEALRTL